MFGPCSVRRVSCHDRLSADWAENMNNRSLLDYLADNAGPEPMDAAREAAQLLERRLAELESRLAAAVGNEAPSYPESTLSSQIEHILRRQQEYRQHRRVEPPVEDHPTPHRRARIEMQPPPLATELPPEVPQRSAEFTRFVEAVHLIGQAANRFLHAPESVRQVLAPRESPGPSEDTLRLTGALKETIAAFQSMTSDLVAAAGEIRRAAEIPKVDAQQPRPQSQPARKNSREDEVYFRLQDDLEDLRERLAAVARRRSRDGY
ncbi:MAG: hypothetical protein JWM58_3727 [Rhizobium sp.]|nr:hypothetical protein [Rhizobium sp.]